MSENSSGSKNPRRNNANKNHRVIMQVALNDSDEDSSDCAESVNLRSQACSSNGIVESDEEFQRNVTLRRLHVRNYALDSDDESSSGSEINVNRRRNEGSAAKKYILSDDENHLRDTEETSRLIDNGFSSDSSSNDILEKCPICLLSFRKQEIGLPSTCEHKFCAKCIEAWAKNVQTCPIDRKVFEHIIVQETFYNRKIVREINVNPLSNKELPLDDDMLDYDDLTHCEICNRPDREDIMLLCDHCNLGYHMDCLSPALTDIPEGSWYCDNCSDSQDEDNNEEDVDDDLDMLYEDIREMGIPSDLLRIREIQQPRILRTRQNERIRAAILRRTRATVSRLESATPATSSGRGQPQTSGTTKTNRLATTQRKPTKRKKRRKARRRTYVLEYDLNTFDEKFAIKTTKKIIRRRRKRKTRSAAAKNTSTKISKRMTASRRLAEQLGVKPDPTFSSHLSGTSASLSLFGGTNGLEYFSDDEIENTVSDFAEGGQGVMASVRISSYASRGPRKGLLLGRLNRNTIIRPSTTQNNGPIDVLSNIIDMQDRWHAAARNLESVRINQDGTLNMPSRPHSANNSNAASSQSQVQNSNDIVHAPMYPRGGNANFHRGDGGNNSSSSYNSKQNNYRGGGNNQYRSTAGGDSGSSNSAANSGVDFAMMGRGNFNFSGNSNYDISNQSHISQYNQRNFNQQQNQRNNNRRVSMQHTNPNELQQPIQHRVDGTQTSSMAFTSLPPPSCNPSSSNAIQNTQSNENISIFPAMLPPVSVPPPPQLLSTTLTTPGLLSVPPPPAPPGLPILQGSINYGIRNPIFSISSNYQNVEENDDFNCPNFAIYSQESQEVAKSSEACSARDHGADISGTGDKEDDENEDLVQLDDDDEIPMPPDSNVVFNTGTLASSEELYEPENPTEEFDDNEDTNGPKDIEDCEMEEEAVKSVDSANGTNNVTDFHENKVDNPEFNDNIMKDDENIKNSTDSPIDDNCNTKDEEGSKACEQNKNNKDANSNNDKVSSPCLSDMPVAETAVSNRKGVLELYDDSDWDELEIDRPVVQDAITEVNTGKSSDDKDIPSENSILIDDNTNIADQDRSYTPCLDENNDPEDNENDGGQTPPLSERIDIILSTPSNTSPRNITENNIEVVNLCADDVFTIISDEEVEADRNKNKEKSGKREKRDKSNNEKFKKVSNKRKVRNYRRDKQMTLKDKPTDIQLSTRSRSRTRSHSRPVFSRARSRSRSASINNHSRARRSRSWSNNKENQSNWSSGNWEGGKRFNRNKGRKRRELPRYDVRSIVGQNQYRPLKDRYGRDSSRPKRSSRSNSRVRDHQYRSKSSFSRSRSRDRCLSISLSLSPPLRGRRRSHSPIHRRFSEGRGRRSVSIVRRRSPYRLQSRSPLRAKKSRSLSLAEERPRGRKPNVRLRGSPPSEALSCIRSCSGSISPRYTPQLSRSRSRSPRGKNKKKKSKDIRKKKLKKRAVGLSPPTHRRILRQDLFDIEKPSKKKRRRSPRNKSPIIDREWSPSPSPPPSAGDFISWTPPVHSPRLAIGDSVLALHHYQPELKRSISRSNRKLKTIKRNKKKKKNEKRKVKKRKRQTETPDTAPSKEVFASGNNILVSVSFNKESTANQQPGPQTIVTLPANREDLHSGTRRVSIDRSTNVSTATRKRKEKRNKVDAKPVAIIDLQHSPFHVEQEPTDVIVLTDSEEAVHRRDRRRSASCSGIDDIQVGCNQRGNSNNIGGQRQKSTESLATIHEESFDLPQTGPKTPPEPTTIKFSIHQKKQNKTRNPLHEDDDDSVSDADLTERNQQLQSQELHRSENGNMQLQSSQKIGPNTPPESGPCSPDAYDPFEPTKSPSISPRSPTPPPSQVDNLQNSSCGGENAMDKHSGNNGDDQQQRTNMVNTVVGSASKNLSLNPVDLVMALINNAQELANKSNESQKMANKAEEKFRDKPEDKTITVLSNVLLSSGNQHITKISSPIPPKKLLANLPKVGGSGTSNSNNGTNMRNGVPAANAEESFNMLDNDSPYSPGSADFEDLFEPPTDAFGLKKSNTKREMFDNLFGSSSPIGNVRLPTYTPSKKNPTKTARASRKSKVKGGRPNNDQFRNYEDVPNSAVDLHVKDKFIRKLNRQERVVEEVKLVLKPRFNKKHITKEDYKEIMRRAVPKICHSRSGEIDPHKIKNLVDAYVKKFRTKHKKLNIVNTGQVSSAVKCAAYLKKL